jgi:hypothetical protein
MIATIVALAWGGWTYHANALAGVRDEIRIQRASITQDRTEALQRYVSREEYQGTHAQDVQYWNDQLGDIKIKIAELKVLLQHR